MISVCQFYTDFKGANNTWQMGHFRPQSFEYALHEAQMEIFNELRRQWEQSQVVSDNLRPFFKSVQVPVGSFPKGGMIPYPADYSMYSSARFFSKTRRGVGVNVLGQPAITVAGGGCCSPKKDNQPADNCEVLEVSKCRPLREEEKAVGIAVDELFERSIDKIDNGRWGAFQAHEFIPPSLDNPGITQYSDGFKVLPSKIGIVILDYLAIPTRPVFIYTIDAKHNIICNANLCTHLQWGEEILPELMSRLKTKFASFTSNAQKWTEGVKETQTVGS